MEINMIGHASLFIKTQDHGILMDPVLWDPHQEGLFDVCPKREVLHERLPPFDFLIISHKHLDHFDIRSLAALPKSMSVLIPQDELIESCLRKLGYKRIHQLKDFSEIKIGHTSILTTASANPVPEFGVIIADETGVFWNQVDTDVRHGTVDFVSSRHPRIDFLLASWQPMLELSYQFNQSLAFPYTEYGPMLDNVRAIKPQAVAPGANAFKYTGGSAWLNEVVFPVTREQFCRDVGVLCPGLQGRIFELDPGDVLTFNKGEFSHQVGGCAFVKKLSGDREELDFSPVTAGHNLRDQLLPDVSPESVRDTICEEAETHLISFIKEHPALFKEHYRWKVIYQLSVVFPEGCRKWSFDFSEAEVRLGRGRHPLSNFCAYITASSFYGLLAGIHSWDYAMMGGYYRRFNKVYAVTPYGLARPESTLLRDPLELLIPYRKILENCLLRETLKWTEAGKDASESREGADSTV